MSSHIHPLSMLQLPLWPYSPLISSCPAIIYPPPPCHMREQKQTAFIISAAFKKIHTTTEEDPTIDSFQFRKGFTQGSCAYHMVKTTGHTYKHYKKKTQKQKHSLHPFRKRPGLNLHVTWRLKTCKVFFHNNFTNVCSGKL